MEWGPLHFKILLFVIWFNHVASHGFTLTFKASSSLSLISGSLPSSASNARLLVETKIHLLRAGLWPKNHKFWLDNCSCIHSVARKIRRNKKWCKIASKVLSLTIPLWKQSPHLLVVTVFCSVSIVFLCWRNSSFSWEVKTNVRESVILDLFLLFYVIMVYFVIIFFSYCAFWLSVFWGF